MNFQKLVLMYCTVFVLFFIEASPVSARTVFEDRFDRQDLSGWTVVRNFQWMNTQKVCMNEGQLASWQILLERLGIIIDGPGCFTEIIPNTFRLNEDQEYTYSFDMTMPEDMSMDRHYTLRYIDPENTMSIKVIGISIFLEKLAQNQGRYVENSYATYPFVAGETYHIKSIVGKNHQITVSVNDLVVLNFVDQEPFLIGGTVGFRASVGAINRSVTWFDNVLVEIPDDGIQLSLPHYSQKDTRWSTAEYDSAKQWGGSTWSVKDWGCALTAAAMVLRYHNISTLPDGTELTPGSLNSWLQSQKDGYLQGGYLNWSALTRLAYQFHQSHTSTPALEYRRSSYATESIRTAFEENRPPIYALQGHFVAGTGMNAAGNLLFINDPFYQDRTAINPDSVLSVRELVPSFTDLSYALFSTNNDTSVRVFSENTLLGVTTPEPVITTEQGQTQLPTSLLEIAKPEDGTYSIEIRKSIPGPYILNIYTYGTTGDVELFTIRGTANERAQTMILEYHANGSTVILDQPTEDILTNAVERLHNLSAITRAYPYLKLLSISQRYGEVYEDAEKRLRQVQRFDYYLDLYKEFIKTESYEELKRIIKSLWPLQDSDL